MNADQAKNVQIGSVVLMGKFEYQVMSVRLGDISGPHFRVIPVGHDRKCRGLTSYKLFTVRG